MRIVLSLSGVVHQAGIGDRLTRRPIHRASDFYAAPHAEALCEIDYRVGDYLNLWERGEVAFALAMPGPAQDELRGPWDPQPHVVEILSRELPVKRWQLFELYMHGMSGLEVEAKVLALLWEVVRVENPHAHEDDLWRRRAGRRLLASPGRVGPPPASDDPGAPGYTPPFAVGET